MDLNDGVQEQPQEASTQCHLRCVRVKDLGSRLRPGQERSEKILEKARPLPPDNRLATRTVYWFIALEQITPRFSNPDSFVWKECFEYMDGYGVLHYLAQIEMKSSQPAALEFVFSNSNIVMHIEFDKQTKDKPSMIAYGTGNNTNQPTDAQHNTPPQQTSVEICTAHIAPPIAYGDGLQRPSSKPLIINILLLVPDFEEYVDMVDCALLKLGFKKEVSSNTQQQLYSELDLIDKERHILLFPYGDISRFRKLSDYLPRASEVILLLENEMEQQNDIVAITQVINVKTAFNDEIKDTIWKFVLKTATFGDLELDYSTLSGSVKKIFSIHELYGIVGGASCKKQECYDNLVETFTDFMSEWILHDRIVRNIQQNMFICFKFEPSPIKAFTEYASKTLIIEKIAHHFKDQLVIVHGSVLLYIHCPSYLPWYILQHEEEIFNTLSAEGLTEIYECFIDDVEASMKREDNQEFVDELLFLKEQMISEGIAETPPLHHRFSVYKSSDLEDTLESQKKVDLPGPVKDFPKRDSVKEENQKEDSVEEKNTQTPSVQTSRIHFARAKDVVRLASSDQRNQRVVEISQPLLPQGNSLTARAIYWFVTTEPVELLTKGTKLFTEIRESITFAASNGITYYLNQVHFRTNKQETLCFRFPDGSVETIYLNWPYRNKRATLPPTNMGAQPMLISHNDLQLDDESQTATNYRIQPFNTDYYDSIYQFGSNINSPNSNISGMQFWGQALPETLFQVQTPPQVLPNGMQVASTEALIVNLLLLVPDNNEYIQMAQSTLIDCGFMEEVSSTTQQCLYSLKMTNSIRHVLLFPYGKAARLLVLNDYLPATSEVILLLENQDGQEDPLMAISHITNFGPVTWEFAVKGADFRPIELNYSTLAQSVKLVLSIKQLREVVVGGASWRKGLGAAQLADPFKNFFLQWTLARVAERVVQNIFICFKYEPKRVIARTEYAAITLAALGIDYDVSVHG